MFKNFMKKKLKSRKIGLALGGGAAWGLAHIGVLKAIEDRGLHIDYIAGTSIGALIGALYADGASIDTLRKTAASVSWISLAKPALSPYGLLSSEPMDSFLSKHLSVLNIEELKIPFAAVAVDLLKGSDVTFYKGPIKPIVRASCSIPGIFTPIELNGRKYIDGGVVNNVPIVKVREMGADFVIGVNLLTSLEGWSPDSSPEIVLKASLISQYYASISQFEKADVMLNIDTKNHSPIDIKGCVNLIDSAYLQTQKILSAITL